MNSLEQAVDTALPAMLSRLPGASRLALEMLASLEGGALAVELPDGLQIRLGHGPMVAHWRLRDQSTFDLALARGDIGLAEAWMDEAWDSDDPTAVLTLLASNRDRLGQAVYGRKLRLIGYRLWHMLRTNTRRGSKRNIEAHYDLGNDFYSLWLDETMTYSAGVFESPADTLEQAQQRKYRRILERLEARPGQTILEVGCGWGGFAEIAASEFGCKVLGLTLSPAQLDHARERARARGFDDLASFELRDYRDVEGCFDHVVSIEMIEAVGERFWPVYFRKLSALLAPGGRIVIQAITISDALFGRYRKGTDFIQRYIFPGGMLPSPSAVREQAAVAGLELVGDFAFGRDYAETLARWNARFVERLHEVREQGFSDRFIRMWRFYLSYCEAGFAVGDIDVHHYEFIRR